MSLYLLEHSPLDNLYQYFTLLEALEYGVVRREL